MSLDMTIKPIREIAHESCVSPFVHAK